MKLIKTSCLTIAFIALTPSLVLAQQPIVYPAKGQSAQQQQKDEGECHVWSKNNTGIDPAALAGAPPPAPPGPAVGGGERLRGAARLVVQPAARSSARSPAMTRARERASEL